MTSWQVSGPGTTSSCDEQWSVASSGSAAGCLAGSSFSPQGSSKAAYASFGGFVPSVRDLYQVVAVPNAVNSATLSWSDTLLWLPIGQPNTYSVFFTDANSNNVGTVYTFTTTSSYGSQGWTNKAFDVTSILGQHLGEQLTLNFQLTVPSLTLGSIGLDNVSLITTAAAVPEPGSVVLLITVLGGLAGLSRFRNVFK